MTMPSQNECTPLPIRIMSPGRPPAPCPCSAWSCSVSSVSGKCASCPCAWRQSTSFSSRKKPSRPASIVTITVCGEPVSSACGTSSRKTAPSNAPTANDTRGGIQRADNRSVAAAARVDSTPPARAAITMAASVACPVIAPPSMRARSPPPCGPSRHRADTNRSGRDRARCTTARHAPRARPPPRGAVARGPRDRRDTCRRICRRVCQRVCQRIFQHRRRENGSRHRRRTA